MKVLPSVLIEERGAIIKLQTDFNSGGHGGGHEIAEINLEEAQLRFLPISYTNPGYHMKLEKIKYNPWYKEYKLYFTGVYGACYDRLLFVIPKVSNKNQSIEEYKIFRDFFTCNPFSPHYYYLMMTYHVLEENISYNNI